MAEKFRMTPQVWFILMLTMVAMAVPLLGVALLAKSYFAPKPAAVAEGSVNPGLEAALEQSADKMLPKPSIEAGRPVLRVSAAGMADLQKLVDGTVLELEPGRRFLVSGPAGTFQKLAAALHGEAETTPELGASEEFFEVEVQP